MATVQPEWRAPPTASAASQDKLPPLRIYNSLTRSKTPFVPLDPERKKVAWYACGPTVYDDAHLGHARNYVSTDIIRRILQDYFRFDVSFVMNITDVDDKIILAARQQHLLADWLARHADVDQDVKDTTAKAFAAYLQRNLPLLPNATSLDTYAQEVERAYGHVLQGKSLGNDGAPAGDNEAKVKMHLNTTRSAAEALQSQDNLEAFALKASGVLLPYLDSLHGSSIQGTDHEIFTKLTKRYEQRFFDDMASLNVRYPDKLTRVTEYGPQIVDFVKRIQDNGFGYENEGSVYYDTSRWEEAGGVYARLEPWNRNDKELQADGEGSLSTKKTGFKRSGADFALWKASKPGEPSWSSPWGEGRPGWHIECSAMASDVLGKQMDIHSGGIDLAFPHHDNELAQSEAYWCVKGHVDPHAQWVNYFLHMGHLSIQGSKMSKSLKNFTTIREALAQGAWTPRGLRIVFLLGAWRDGLEITGEVVKAGVAWEERVTNFFIRVADIQARSTTDLASATDSLDLNSPSDPILQALATAQQKFHNALCDSFDTPTAMRVLSDLITAYNSAPSPSDATSLALARWLTTIVQTLGLDNTPPALPAIGWSGISIPPAASTHVPALSTYRDAIRHHAVANMLSPETLAPPTFKVEGLTAEEAPYATVLADFVTKVTDLSNAGAAPKEFLQVCDWVRDEALWNLGIYLEDRPPLPALIRPLSSSLKQERADREAAASSKAAAKQKSKEEAERAEKEKLEKGKLDPREMFRTSEYSEWDADGVPTKDGEGKEVVKSRGKKLRKEWERQKKLHEAWVGSQAQ